ncbi:MAG: deoxyribodipyrimidine photo-lyase, partial [Desulfomonilia bacterium]|nr:deoxyribodipyrimidine photo-lyase [Desulfomonilia bacterium]
MVNRAASGSADFVLYWMQQSQRAEYNHALEYASEQANEQNLPLVVLFCLMDGYPDANLRHYQFMMEGLLETRERLASRGIFMAFRHGSPGDIVPELARRASLVVCDRGYLRHQKSWRSTVAERVPCPLVQVESDV